MAKGKRVLITGSTRGIGKAAAACLLEAGAEVVLHGRQRPDVDRAVAELGKLSSGVSGAAGELSDRDAIGRLAADVGEVDVLVNCAGVYHEHALASLDACRWNATIDVNLTAPWLLTRALLAGLRRRRGLVVNVASDAALLGFAGGVPYCASKGALVGLTKALAVELAPDVRAIAIAPGPVDTDMMTSNVAGAADPSAELARWSAYPLLKRVAAPREIGAMIAFACSEAAAFATGAVWSIDGGITAGKRP
jgi:NAD(P)-dependent dehydrogenase (short-subunit alcohol dehydrogenase family)